MKFFRTIVPNLSISLSLALIVAAILDYYNPLMGFLQSTPARVLIITAAVFAIAASLASYIAWRNEPHTESTERGKPENEKSPEEERL